MLNFEIKKAYKARKESGVKTFFLLRISYDYLLIRLYDKNRIVTMSRNTKGLTFAIGGSSSLVRGASGFVSSSRTFFCFGLAPGAVFLLTYNTLTRKYKKKSRNLKNWINLEGKES